MLDLTMTCVSLNESSVNCKHAYDVSSVMLSVLLHVPYDRETSTKYSGGKA